MSTTAGIESGSSTDVTSPALRKRFLFTVREWKQLRLASIFILPWLIGLFGFTLYPIFYTVYLSFTRYSGIKPRSGSASTTTDGSSRTRSTPRSSGIRSIMS